MANKMTLCFAGTLALALGTAHGADLTNYKDAVAAAKSAIAAANAVGGEWRDTGIILAAAEKAAAAGDFDRAVKLANEAEFQGLAGTEQAKQQADVGNPSYLY